MHVQSFQTDRNAEILWICLLNESYVLTESWYLVKYEDNCQLRVLHEDEVRHIFTEDNEEDIQVDDIVSALWIPNGRYYDAKVLQIGGEWGISI